jgi:hypothetical protein
MEAMGASHCSPEFSKDCMACSQAASTQGLSQVGQGKVSSGGKAPANCGNCTASQGSSWANRAMPAVQMKSKNAVSSHKPSFN